MDDDDDGYPIVRQKAKKVFAFLFVSLVLYKGVMDCCWNYVMTHIDQMIIMMSHE